MLSRGRNLEIRKMQVQVQQTLREESFTVRALIKKALSKTEEVMKSFFQPEEEVVLEMMGTVDAQGDDPALDQEGVPDLKNIGNQD